MGAQTCLANTRQGHGKKKSTWELGKKNQTDAGRVSQYTSPLQRNVSLFSQAIGSQARFRFIPSCPYRGHLLTFIVDDFKVHWAILIASFFNRRLGSSRCCAKSANCVVVKPEHRTSTTYAIHQANITSMLSEYFFKSWVLNIEMSIIDIFPVYRMGVSVRNYSFKLLAFQNAVFDIL